jgi:hypothetical protein
MAVQTKTVSLMRRLRSTDCGGMHHTAGMTQVVGAAGTLHRAAQPVYRHEIFLVDGVEQE